MTPSEGWPVTTDTSWLEQALDAALLGPESDPNPRVGAVVLDAEGQVAGVGHHRGAGTVHAEVDALRQAGPRAAGGTAYITLEPCAHHGRTAPCAEALQEAGIARVVYAVSDPTAEAGGGGVKLQHSGLEVEQVHLPAAEELVEHWALAVRLGRPWVTVKMASTLDGRIAAADGSSAWITSPEARADGHKLRAVSGAIMVGTGTIAADNPSLTARYDDGDLLERQPLRVVVGQRPLTGDVKVVNEDAPTKHFQTHDVAAVLRELFGNGIRRVLVEGGPTLIAALWQAGLVDEVVNYIAPALLGDGPSAISGLGIDSMDGIARLDLVDVQRVGSDVRLTSRPRSAHTTTSTESRSG